MNKPIWQLPVGDSEYSINEIASNAKYHCFIETKSLCGKYIQYTSLYDTDIESGEIASRPEIACKVCRNKWMKQFKVLS